ncbi:MAG: helix-hairpin-helix domain-containing protein [Deltaproteobacteria bacterium]|nr:helix-hairpin-helix domain-containing protein [Deltaproteobacteria bacterium]
MTARKMLLIAAGIISVFFLVFLSTAEAGEKSAEPSLSKAEALSGAKVDINKAGLDQLVTLPGIGPKTAEKIMQYRQENGKFKDPEDLKKVRGIGEKNFEKIRPLIKI